MENILERTWNGAGDAWEWLRGVILGEWEEDKSTSQVVTDALAGFVPGVGSLITLRDLVAIIVRLARHPEKREQVDEWILLIAMLLPLVITAIGALAAGVGALVGAELGGFLRALTLMLVKKGGVALKAIVEFFQAHGYGDAIKALKDVRFAQYRKELLDGFNAQLDRLAELTRAFQARLRTLSPQSLPIWLPGRDKLIAGIAHCDTFIEQLNALRTGARKMIPAALIELDNRLAALMAGDLRAATHITHSIATGQAAPAVGKLESHASIGHEAPALKNPDAPEPGNTRRLPERRVIALAGKREYRFVDEAGRPVGAKPYEHEVTRVENPSVELSDWARVGPQKVKEGWPNLANEYAPDRYATDYANFSGHIRPGSIAAGSPVKLKRVVAHDKPEMDTGPYYNRDLPIDGQDLRAGSAVKEAWNNDGQFVELRVPPKGHPVWRELHALQERAAAGPVRYDESLKFWEGPAASQVYKVREGADEVYDKWYLSGGKLQQFFDREQMKVLKTHGFVTERQASGFPDFDPQAGNIVHKDGPYFEVVPLDEAVPPPRTAKK